MMAIHRPQPWIALALLTGGTSGCVVKETIDNPLHCSNNAGDSSCADLYPDGSRPFCASGEGDCAIRYISGTQRYCHTNGACTDVYDGCMANQPDDECYAQWGRELPPGSGSSSDEGSSSDTDMTTTSGTPATGGGSGTGPGMCNADGDCMDDDKPLCVDEDCVRCEDGPNGGCEAKDPLTPVCDDGACVQCTADDAGECGGSTPVCDPALRLCVPCNEHPQCPDSACNLVDGSCMSTDRVIHVDGDSGRDFASIGIAVDSVEAGGAAVIIVHERGGSAPYAEAVTIDSGKTIAMLAAADETPVIQGTGGNPGLLVQGAETVVYLDELRLTGNTSGHGLVVDEAVVWVDRTWVVQNSDGGVLVQNGGDLTLRNCFVNGPIDGDAVSVNGAMLDMLYTTVGAGPAALGQTHALFCEGRAMVGVRNSVLLSLGDDPEIECPGVSVTSSATESEVGFDATWFVDYVDGDFHLAGEGPKMFGSIAVWLDGDPSVDIDSDERPNLDSAADHAGGDSPQ